MNTNEAGPYRGGVTFFEFFPEGGAAGTTYTMPRQAKAGGQHVADEFRDRWLYQKSPASPAEAATIKS